MLNRRFAQVSTSDNEDEAPPSLNQRTRKRVMMLQDEDDEEAFNESAEKKRMPNDKQEEEDEEEEEEDPSEAEESDPSEAEESDPSEAEEEKEEVEEGEENLPKPIGEPVRVSGIGTGRNKHFKSFMFDGNQYTLEDPVLLVPADRAEKPYVAIIKDITQTQSGNMKVKGQWLYRPEEATKKCGITTDIRELFYSFHQDEFDAETVMHKCVVHFLPMHKQLPNRKQHPGFIVQRVYDPVEKKLWKLTDKDYEDNKQQEIDELVQKTLRHLGELPDIKADEADREDLVKNKGIKTKSISLLDVSTEEAAPRKGDQHLKSGTPGSCLTNTSEFYRILVDFNALTGDTYRDKWLEKLLGTVQYMFDTDGSIKKEVKGNDNSDAMYNRGNNKTSEFTNEFKGKVQKSSTYFVWPDVAVSAVVALEKASHDTLSSDYQKYNQRLRKLDYNLKQNAILARRLLNRELEPSKILNMTPNELKEGLTAEEITKNEPEESQHMQMTDARCKRCDERKVGLRDIIHTGRVERYMLECITCGHTWSVPSGAVSILTLEASDSKKIVGTAPGATPKFEDVQKKLASLRESDKLTNDIFMKPSKAYMPVLDAQKSFGKSMKDENGEASRHAD